MAMLQQLLEKHNTLTKCVNSLERINAHQEN